MKNKLLLLLAILCSVSYSYSQTLSLSPDGVFAKCPDEFILYTYQQQLVITSGPLQNGEIQGGFLNGNISTFTGGTLVQIKWFNTTSGGSIQIVANCSPTSGNGNGTWSIPILSINGVNPGTVSGASPINVNVTSNQIYTVPQINYPNIGTGDVNPKQVNSYEWEIPAGWTVVSGGNTVSS